MASPVLLVADDLSLIASVKRVLAREGYECVLATSAADAVIAFGHLLPGVMLLQPSVESERGEVILEELKLHPDAKLLKVVLLGETIPGYPWPVEPLPIDGAHLAETINENVRSADTADDWSVRETAAAREDVEPLVPRIEPAPPEPEQWRATRPSGEEQAVEAGPPEPASAPAPTPPPPSEDFTPVAEDPAAEALAPEAEPALPDEPPAPVDSEGTPAPAPLESSPSLVALTERLFGDLPSIEDEVHRDVEAQVLASVESTLAKKQTDDELQQLEDEVLAEAQRRRVSRESRIIAAAELEAPPASPPVAGPAATLTGDEGEAETSFGELVANDADLFASSPSTAQIPQSRAREVLARAEQMVLESRAVSEAQRRVDDAEARRARAEFEAVERRAEHAESLVRREREVRAGLEDELERLRETVKELGSVIDHERAEAADRQLQTEVSLTDERTALQNELSHTQAALTERDAEVARLSAQLAELNAENQSKDERLGELAKKKDEKIAELTRQREERLAELNRQQAETISALTRRHDDRLTDVRRELAEAHAARDIALSEAANASELAKALDTEKAQHQSTRRALAEAETNRGEFEKENALVEQARTDAELARQAADEAKERLEGELQAATSRVALLEKQLLDAKELVDEATLQRGRVQHEEAQLTATLTEAKNVIAARDAEVAELKDQLERAAQRHLGTLRELAQLKDTLDGTRSRAEEAEATATLVAEKVKQLENRELMPLSLPSRRALGVARHGTVDLEGLSRLFCQLVLAQADLRIELGAAGGTRTLWLKKGLITAAHSDFDAESLIDRARRDGLIDTRQEAELRMLRTATMREQLEALKTRGFIRDIEAIPLVQRCAEQIALEALSEETSQYRLNEDPPGHEVMLVTVPRPTLPLLAEALRRALPLEALLEKLGGGEAIPTPTDSDADLRALGFSDRERKMISWVDGEATVEDVSLASGLKPEVAFRALLVAKFLGVVEVKPPSVAATPVDADLDVHRLEAKFDEVQDADYFTILGLPRSAGSEDVQRAWQRLSTEFHPLRYSGHPDAGLQQRAQVVFSLLEEAARALEDDRRRIEYARHLLD